MDLWNSKSINNTNTKEIPNIKINKLFAVKKKKNLGNILKLTVKI